MWAVPVTAKSWASARSSAARSPSSSAAAKPDRRGARHDSSTARPRARTPATAAATLIRSAASITRIQSADRTRINDRQRSARACLWGSISPGFSAAAGRRPRPNTRIQSPTPISGGEPIVESTARPLACRQPSPSRTRRTATTHAVVGGRAGPAKRGEGEASASRRGGSTTTASMATGTGVSPRLQARSSAAKRLQRTDDQQAIAAATAISSASPAGRPRPRRTSHSHAASASHATAYQPATLAKYREAATPPAAATATTISGRWGSGSRRIHDRSGPTCSASQARPSASHSQSLAVMPAMPVTSAHCLFHKARAGQRRGKYFRGGRCGGRGGSQHPTQPRPQARGRVAALASLFFTPA